MQTWADINGQARVCHSSFLAHTVIAKILEAWGPSGFEQHVTKACTVATIISNHTPQVRTFYQSQAAHMLAAATKHLTGLAEWSEPTAGMFMWFKLLVSFANALLARQLACRA